MNLFILLLSIITISQASGKTIGRKGLNTIKHFEGLRLKAYQDSVGIWTIGYGHTRGVKRGDRISTKKANAYLIKDVRNAEWAVNRYVKVRISQDQFDALVSWTFNLGSGNLRSSTMLKKLNKRRFDRVPCEMIRWVRAGGKILKGLVKRRNAEARLFNGGSFTC